MHFGIEIAAYSSMVDWDSCAYLLFSKEEGVFRRRILQVGKQFLSRSFCYRSGEHSAHSFSIYYVVFVLIYLLCILNIHSFSHSFILQAVCTILAMIATLPLVQLFFFHILLIKKVRHWSLL